ncbi:MAG: OmpA family protein [Deltaproteobacteria bacterium]|nr:OmpA family protein [Deltaproteobacteria bacterium]
MSVSAVAQQDFAGYDAESAGIIDYSDSEAAGDASLPADSSSDAVVPDAAIAPAPAVNDSGAADGAMSAAAGGDAASSADFGGVADFNAGNGGMTATGVVDAATGMAVEEGEATAAAQVVDDEALPTKSTAAVNGRDDKNLSRTDKPDWAFGAVRHHTGWSSTAGLMDIKEAGSNATGTLAMGIFAGFFKYSDYLEKGDENKAMAGTLNLRATVWQYLELHSAIRTYANHNSNEYPALFQTIGDLQLGAKGFYSFNDMITAGLDLNFNFMNAVGDVGMDWSGTSVGIDALGTFDFAAINERVPLRMHVMLGYLFDNAYHIIEDVENAGGGCGTDFDGDGEVEYTGCLSPIERTALGIDRNDQFHIGLGADAALPYVSPILEYHIDIPVNRQNFTCPQIPGSYDSCMADEGGKAMRQWLNIGVRGLPPVKGLAIDFGLEIGVAGYAPSVHELAAQEPYMVKFGLSYQLNPFEEPEKCEPVEKIVEAPVAAADAPRGAQIVGMVHDSESTDMPVADAVVIYQGLELNPQVTSAAGRFNSYELPAGDVALVVSAPGYEEQQFSLTLPETGFIEQFFPLIRKPMKGVVTVQIVNAKGEPVADMPVEVTGMTTGTFTSDADGMVMLETDSGAVTFVVNDEKFMHKQLTVEVKPDAHEKATMELKAKGKTALAEVKKDRIRIRRKIHFQTNSDVINENSFELLDEVADILLKNPQIQKVEIQGHTDDRGNREHNIELSQKRAESVRLYLINAGVAGDRLEAVGYGPARPLAPNVINTGRAKNRRVEFHITTAE